MQENMSIIFIELQNPIPLLYYRKCQRPDKKDRKNALADHEHFLNNRESILKAKYGVDIKFAYDPTKRRKYDAARYAREPDYK